MAGYITLEPELMIVSSPPSFDYLKYYGNYKGVTAQSPSIELEDETWFYYLDLSSYTSSQTANITIDPDDFGFTAQKTGGEIRIAIKLPASSANIPTITFGSNITFADYEEVEIWEAGKTYYFDLRTINSGTNWLITETEEQ